MRMGHRMGHEGATQWCLGGGSPLPLVPGGRARARCSWLPPRSKRCRRCVLAPTARGGSALNLPPLATGSPARAAVAPGSAAPWPCPRSAPSARTGCRRQGRRGAEGGQSRQGQGRVRGKGAAGGEGQRYEARGAACRPAAVGRPWGVAPLTNLSDGKDVPPHPPPPPHPPDPGACAPTSALSAQTAAPAPPPPVTGPPPARGSSRGPGTGGWRRGRGGGAAP